MYRISHFKTIIELSSRSDPLISSRPLDITSCVFPIQAGALVHVYTDGSVLLTHGGTEMGQGLHTKMVQVSISSVNSLD